MQNGKDQSEVINTLFSKGVFNLTTQGNGLSKNVIEKLESRGEILSLESGQIIFSGLPLNLFRYFDNLFLNLAYKYGATEIVYSTLISKKILEKAEYFQSFPSTAVKVDNLYYLSPAVCYHTYQQLQNSELKSTSVTTSIGKCFRKEPLAYKPLERQMDFTMREIIFIGKYNLVEKLRKSLIEEIFKITKSFKLDGIIKKTNDPFFTSNYNNRGKRLLQQLKPLKFELQLLLKTNEYLAVCSFNNHEEFFGEHFNIRLSNNQPVTSGCVAFGLERWVLAFLTQHSINPKLWPDPVRKWVVKND